MQSPEPVQEYPEGQEVEVKPFAVSHTHAVSVVFFLYPESQAVILYVLTQLSAHVEWAGQPPEMGYICPSSVVQKHLRQMVPSSKTAYG